MKILDRVEGAIEKLLAQNHKLKIENGCLHREKVQWAEERSYLLEEIDRILKRLDSMPLEES